MAKPDYLKLLWQFMKGNGRFKTYLDYETWRKDKYNLKEEPSISKQAENVPLGELEKFAEKLPQEKKEKFVDTLEGKEKADFLYVFGED